MATVGFVVIDRAQQFSEQPGGRYAIPLPGQTRHLGGQTRHPGDATPAPGAATTGAATTDPGAAIPDRGGQARHVGTAGIKLSDDDAGNPLFDLAGLAPGHPVSNCIAVTYDGGAKRAAVKLALRASGSLAPGLTMTVEVGSGGRYGNCDGFRPMGELFHDSVARFAQDYAPEAGGLLAFDAKGNGQTATFRFIFEVTDLATQGASVSADFLWTASA
jgi:hypothetical protein